MFHYNKDSTTYGVARDAKPFCQDDCRDAKPLFRDAKPLFPTVGSRTCCIFLWGLTPEAARNYIDRVAVQVTWNQRHTSKDVCPAQFQISNIEYIIVYDIVYNIINI
jgi:hypothetical protein